jgi:hypothetical protein
MTEELTMCEAAGKLVWHLAHGDALSNDDAGVMVGLSEHGAYKMLCRLSRVVPIYQDELGFWQVLALKETED